VLFQSGRRDEARAAMRKALAWNTPEPSFARHAKLILALE
jgi:Flp pilus assembly protein TadD